MEIQEKTVSSKSEFKDLFERMPEPRILIESNEASPNQYKIVQINSCTVGIIDHSFGVPMQIEAIDDNLSVAVGHESQLDCIGLKDAHLRWTVKLDSIFFQYKFLRDLKRIIVIEETGALAIDHLGNRIWSIATDIIVDFEITESYVRIKTIEDFDLKISVKTGELLG